MEKEHWQDWGTALVALWLIVSPWVLGTPISGTIAIWNLWIVGLILIGLAASELSVFRPWKEWAIAGLGGWLVVAARVLNLPSASIRWNEVVCGLVVVALSAWAIGDRHELLPRLGRPKGDLRGNLPSMSLPDEHEHLAGASAHRPDSGPEIVRPGGGTQTPGQISHE